MSDVGVFLRVDDEAGDPLTPTAEAGDFTFKPGLLVDSVLDAGRLLIVNLIPPEAVLVILLVTP